MENRKVRLAARGAGIQLWRIAAAMGVSEPTMTRWFRRPLSPEREKAIMEIIEKLSEEEKSNG